MPFPQHHHGTSSPPQPRTSPLLRTHRGVGLPLRQFHLGAAPYSTNTIATPPTTYTITTPPAAPVPSMKPQSPSAPVGVGLPPRQAVQLDLCR